MAALKQDTHKEAVGGAGLEARLSQVYAVQNRTTYLEALECEVDMLWLTGGWDLP